MTFANPAWFLLALPVSLAWLFYARSRVRWLLIALLLILGLSDPSLHGWRGAGGNIVLLVDRSASAQGEGERRARALAPELERHAAARQAGLYVVGFGRGAALLARPGESFDAQSSAADDSDLQAGLLLAAAQPDVSEIVLVSDGVYTTDDPSPLALQLRQQGVRIHTSQVGERPAADAAITRILAPQRVPRGQPFAVAIEVDSPQPQAARLKLRDQHGQVVYDQPLQLEAGARRYALQLDGSDPGVHALDAELEIGADTRKGNNLARSVVEVVGAPRVIVYTHNPGSALVRALGSTGIDLVVRSRGEALSLPELGDAVAVVLENMPLSELGDAADAALDSYVRKLGGGLLITGGDSSYAAGGYYRSKLEQLLPVSMDRKDELRRPRVEMAIVLDRSGSMAAPAANGAQKMDLANRGAGEAITLLAPDDSVAVFAVDTVAHVVAPLQRVGKPSHRQQVIEQVKRVESSGGGIYIELALRAAMDTLLRGSAQTRHILLFSDAADSEEPGDYRALVGKFRSAGGTLSVIGLGTEADSDAGLLREIAKLGGGRVYFTADAMQLPRVFAQDVMYVARKTFIAALTPVEPARGLLALQLPLDAVPSIAGYNLCYLLPGAEPALISVDDQHAPLVASWQRGAGKVMAVMFEADGPYTGEIAGWQHYKPFFRSALEWIKRPSGDAELDADLRLEGRQAVVRVELPAGHRQTTAPEALLFADDGSDPRALQLTWTGPNTLEARAPIDSDRIYSASIALPDRPALKLPWSGLPYSPEFAAHSGWRTGEEVLSQLAEASGGGVYTRVQDLNQQHSRPNQRPRSLADMCAWLALALLLLDIAQRRGLLDGWWHAARSQGQQLAAAARKRLPRRRPPQAAVDAEPELATEHPAPPEPHETTSPLAEAKHRARRRY